MTGPLRLPDRIGRQALIVACATWAGTTAGLVLGSAAVWVAGVIVVVAVALRHPWLTMAAFLAAGSISGWLAEGRIDSTLDGGLPSGVHRVVGRVAEDPVPVDGGYRFVLRPEQLLIGAGWEPWRGPAVAVASEWRPAVAAGDTVLVEGRIRTGAAIVRGDPVAGSIDASELGVVAAAAGPLFGPGNLLRRRVASGLEAFGGRPEAALLSGFLIGDVSELPEVDAEALRRAGLTHFVAVSGSNVALFLGAWWVLTIPLSIRPRGRALIGLFGLALFVVITRWEPSVVRASAMVALILFGRLLGVPVSTWAALGGAVTCLLLVSGQLAGDVGFQLSVAATAGVLAGSSAFARLRPRFVGEALGATIAAQAAVLPLLLWHFGTVPLLSPVANLLAAPLVVVSTSIGGIGVIAGIDTITSLGTAAASWVLWVARIAQGWPQLGVSGVGGVAIAGFLATRQKWRPYIMLALAAGIATTTLSGPSVPAETTITFLDVGQGDAVLIREPGGGVVLIDGGRDPVVLGNALRRYGVGRVDVLVVTHGDADHVGGLVEAPGRLGVGRLWYPDLAVLGPLLEGLVTDLVDRGVPVEAQRAGTIAHLGELTITVLGPQRRYASDNDGSVTLWIEANHRTALLAGDIEAVAQRELPPLRPDLLLVPHHGSATTDLAWLDEAVAPVNVISVGPNTYGHPSADVLDVLAASGMTVLSTREDGDITVTLR